MLLMALKGVQVETVKLNFTPLTNRGPRAWELSHYEVDETHYYWAGPDENPTEFPPAQDLRFETPGGPDVPSIEMRNAMPLVRAFEVARPGLPTGDELLSVGAGNSLQFVWTPEQQDGVELVVRFEALDAGFEWSVGCWVEDDGSFEIEPSLLEQLPSDMEGEAWIRRYETRYEEASDENPEMWFTGAFQHHWTIVLEAVQGPGPGPGPVPG